MRTLARTVEATARVSAPVVPEPNLKLARVFLRMLDASREHWDFRTFDDDKERKDEKLARKLRGTLDEHAAALQYLNQLGTGVFVTVNRTDGKGICKKNVTEIVAVWADTDGALLEPLLALKPHIVIESSPGKWHVYWRVHGCPLDQFESIQMAIAKKFGTDPAVKDAGRVMRLPGFYHNKGEPFLVMFVPKHMDPSRELYTVAEVVEGLGLTLEARTARPGDSPGGLRGAPGTVMGVALDPALRDAAAALGDNTSRPPPPETLEEIDKVKSLLAAIPADTEYPEWRDVVWAVLATGWDCAVDLARDWSKRGDKWSEEGFVVVVRDFKPDGGIGFGTLVHIAKEHGYAPATGSDLASTKTTGTPGGFVSFGPFTMDAADGLTKEVKSGRSQNATVEAVWVSAPIEVLGKSRAPGGKAWGKQLRFEDGDGRPHLMQILDAELHGEPSALCAKLADNGLTINRERQRDLAQYLSAVNVNARVTVVSSTGWHEIGGRMAFVLPSETIGAHDVGAVVLDTGATSGAYESSGEIADWRSGVARLSAGQPAVVLAISMALMGPLARLVGGEPGGIHFVGQSSIGKTSLLASGASVWGRGEVRNGGFIRSWRATDNGLEGVAASASDTCLLLDEIGQGAAQAVAQSIYSLSNGVGKVRAERSGAAREPKSWRVAIISSGEVGIAAKIGEDRGKAVKAGQTVRMVDIQADQGLGFGVFDNAGSFDHAGELADAIKAEACRSYGTAGPEFVRRIIAGDADRVAEQAKMAMTEFVAEFTAKDTGEQVVRVAKVFALIAVAGELATTFKITPWERGEARAAAARAFGRWLEKRGGGGSHEGRQAVEKVRLMIEQHGESRFEDSVGELHRVRDRLGWRNGDGATREWWVPVETWKSEICAGLDPTFVARTLAAQGMLRRQDTKNLTCVVKAGGQSIRAYVLTAKILDGGEA